MKTFDGYKKQALTDVYALLAGGGHKPLSEFSMAHTHPYLPLNGGNMKGNIGYTGSNGTLTMIRFLDNVNNSWGYGLCLGGGGTTIVGSGESLNSFANGLTDVNDEVLYLLSDNHIQFGTGYDSVKWTYLDQNRNFYPGTNNTGSIGTSSSKWANMYATTFHGSLDGNAATATTASMLKTSTWSGGYYATSDTHYMCLGYMNCTNSYDALTLLISSAFWGNQHGSQDIITILQDTNTGDTRTIQTTVGRLRLGGSYERTFYYYKDNTNFRLYIYVYVTGGNSYGKWNISYLGGNATWVNIWQTNVTKDTSWSTIEYSAQVNYANSAGSASTATTASKLGTSTIGATNVPIYLNSGTPTVVNLNSTANNLINNLSEGTSTPTDADYYVSQYVGGGTTTTTYHRRPHSALYAYIKGKAEGTWNISINGNSASATNADKVDGYHASSLWRSDGATWNPGANVSLNASGNNQEWSFDIRRNGYTGCYWHVWDSSLNSMLKVNADNGKVYAPYNFVGNLEGNASTATKLQIARTLWGQLFDGTGNVSGFMRNVSGLIYQGTLNEDWSDGNNTHPWYGIDYRYCINSTEIGKAYTSISSYFGLYFKTGGSRFIFDGGNVGIGTTSPSYKLHVTGDIYTTTGFKKNGSSDSYVLLGGGGHKLISDFAISEHNHDGRYLRYFRYTTSPNADSMEDGWHDAKAAITNAPTANHGTLIQNSYNGTPFQIFIPDASYYIYKRYKAGSIGGTWTKIYAGYADSAGNADKVDGLHVHGGTNNEANKIVRTDGNGFILAGWINTISGDMGTTAINKIYCSNDNYIRYKTPANFFPTLTNSGDNISITVASLNRTLTVLYATIAGLLRSKGTIAPLTERTLSLGDIYSYHLNASVSGGPTTYAAVIGFGKGTAGTVEIAGEWTSGRGIWVRALRDCCDNWYSWDKILTLATYTGITDSRYYTKIESDNRFVNVTGDTMTGTLTTVTTGTGSWNQGIRINRTATNQWATLLIGKSGTATTGTGTSTAGDGAWLIATPASSNSLIFNLNSASETVGLCLKGHGNTDIKWNNNTIWHAGNDGSGSGLDADTLDSYHASYFAPTSHNHDDRYIKKIGDIPTNAFDLIITPTNLDREHVIDPGGGIHIKAHTGTPFQLWLHDTSNVWYKKTGNGAWVKMDAGHADNADMVDGYHANGLLTALSNSNNGVSITVGGTTKSISNISVNYANSAGSASSASIATKLASSGYANNALSYYQTDQAFDGSATGWAHYIIANHGDGSSYYHYTIRLPFGNVPQYRRQTGSTSDVTSWYNFITAENIGSQSVNYANSAGNADKVDGYHKTDLIGNLSKGNWNPRGTNLAMDWHYNGGDMSISENGGKIFISIDGSFWLNEGQYKVLDTSDVGNLSVKYANSAGNADTLDGLHASAFATAFHSHPYLPLSGGTMTGLIKGNNKGGSWISGRSNAALYLSRTTENDWHPVVGFKTKTGSWEFGSVGDDFATFSWGSDSNYNSGTNTTTIVHLRTISGTIALTSDIPTKSSWNYDDRYSKLGHTHDDRYYTESEINSKLGAYLPLSGGTMRGNITYTGIGTSYIGNGESDGANGVGGALNNLVISSWLGVSFTTSCSGQTYTNKNAVSINCRNGYVYANTFVGAFSGNASSATSASKWTTARTLTLTGSVTGSVSIDGSSNVTLTTTTNHTHNWANIEGKPSTFTPSFHTHDDRYYTESEVNTKLGAYLPLSGGTMNANARISFNDDGALYIGRLDNSEYVYFQDMASQDGADYWLISQEGSAYFRGTVTATTFSGTLSGNATTATTASKLGSSTVGSDTRHFYLNAGTATASMATVGGTAKPMYLKAGVMTALSVTVGSTDTPVYLNGGTITSCGKSFSSYLPLSGGTMTGSIITPANDDMGIIPYNNNYGQIGSSTKKFYRMYATTFYGSLSGNAATATNADKLDGYHASSFALSEHTHTLSLATDTGSSSIALVHGGKYKLTAGGNSIIFTLPTSNSTNPTDFYWANVKVSASSSTTTSPTFSYLYTTNTVYAEDVNANSAVYTSDVYTDYIEVNYDINASGSIYATHFYENSDIRYKKILRNLSINSNIIANLPLFDFEWIENNVIGTGTSALAVLLILPNLVSGTDKLTLDYGVLGTIAGITACKELVMLKSELLQLKEKVKLLEDKLRKYENI